MEVSNGESDFKIVLCHHFLNRSIKNSIKNISEKMLSAISHSIFTPQQDSKRTLMLLSFFNNLDFFLLGRKAKMLTFSNEL